MSLFGVLDSHARIYPLQENKKELIEEQGVDYFLKLCGSLMKKKMINPNGLSQKTLKTCYLLRGGGDSSKSRLKWQNEGTLFNGEYTTQRTTEYRKTESEFILSDILEKEVAENYYLSQEKVNELLKK